MKTGLILNTIIIFIITILAFFVQSLSQRSVFYGVRIPIGFEDNKELIKEDKMYKFNLLILEGLFYIIGSIMIVNLDEDYAPIIIMLSVFGAIFINWICYFITNKRIKAIKVKENWSDLMTKENVVVVDLNMKNRKEERLSSWYFVPNIILFIGVSIVNIINYKKADIKMIIIFLVILLIMYLSFISVNKARQDINGGEVNIIRAQNIKFRKRIGIFIIITSYLSSILFSVASLSVLNIISPEIEANLIIATIGLTLLISIFIIIYSFKIGQSGKNIKVKNEKESEIINKDDDDDYKIGMFYYNRNDSAVFVEKRSGAGYTINFATTMGKVLALFSAVLVVGTLVLITYMCTSMKVDLTVDDSSINIKGMYSENINRKDIKEIKVEEKLPNISAKQDGANVGKKRIGWFKTKSGDKVKLFVENDESGVIKIVTGEKTMYINFADNSKTKELYEKLNNK